MLGVGEGSGAGKDNPSSFHVYIPFSPFFPHAKSIPLLHGLKLTTSLFTDPFPPPLGLLVIQILLFFSISTFPSHKLPSFAALPLSVMPLLSQKSPKGCSEHLTSLQSPCRHWASKLTSELESRSLRFSSTHTYKKCSFIHTVHWKQSLACLTHPVYTGTLPRRAPVGTIRSHSSCGRYGQTCRYFSPHPGQTHFSLWRHDWCSPGGWRQHSTRCTAPKPPMAPNPDALLSGTPGSVILSGTLSSSKPAFWYVCHLLLPFWASPMFSLSSASCTPALAVLTELNSSLILLLGNDWWTHFQPVPSYNITRHQCSCSLLPDTAAGNKLKTVVFDVAGLSVALFSSEQHLNWRRLF